MNQSPRVLIVEDNEKLRTLLQSQLEYAGCSVQGTGHVKPALEMARACDLVVLDLKLEEPDGKEILRQLRSERNFVPAIIMSGFPEMRHEIEALEIVHWLDKPFSLKHFSEVVQQALETVGHVASIRENTSRLSSWLARQERKHEDVSS